MTISALSSSGLGALQARASYAIPVGAVVQSLKAMDPSVAPPKLPPGFAPPEPPDPALMMAAMSQAGVLPDNDPSKLFAEVRKNGEVVARLYNDGSSATYGLADGIIDGVDEPFDGGPQLAQWRAAKIARELGGTVKMASTAQTQSQWQITDAAEDAVRDKIMAPQRAAMDTWRAAMDQMLESMPVRPSVTA
jgi:hypothetical protein